MTQGRANTNPVSQSPESHWRKKWNVATKILEGTFVGVLGRWGTFPLEIIYIQRSKQTNLSYGEITKHYLKPKNLFETQINLFFRTGFLQTIFKAASTMGVDLAVDKYYPNVGPIERGLRISFYSTPLEVAATARYEYRKLLGLAELNNNTGKPVPAYRICTLEFFRFAMATSLRCGWSSLVTFNAIYCTEELFKALLPESSRSKPYVSAIAAGVSSFAVQPLIMPVINIQTHQATNPQVPVQETFNYLKREGMLWKGTLGRSVNRGAYYTLAFFMKECMKRRRVDAQEQVRVQDENNRQNKPTRKL